MVLWSTRSRSVSGSGRWRVSWMSVSGGCGGCGGAFGGRGGIAATARATGMAVDTIRKGIAELQSGQSPGAGRVRRPGAGRPARTRSDPSLAEDLERHAPSLEILDVDVVARREPRCAAAGVDAGPVGGELHALRRGRSRSPDELPDVLADGSARRRRC